jgi:hypothetical protein
MIRLIFIYRKHSALKTKNGNWRIKWLEMVWRGIGDGIR